MADFAAEELAQAFGGFQSGPDEYIIGAGGDGDIVDFGQVDEGFGYGVGGAGAGFDADEGGGGVAEFFQVGDGDYLDYIVVEEFFKAAAHGAFADPGVPGDFGVGGPAVGLQQGNQFSV